MTNVYKTELCYCSLYYCKHFQELKQVLSKDFFEVISNLKTKDPKIYNPEVQFFKNEKAQGGLDPIEKMQKRKETREKPIFLRDYERKLITEREGKLSDYGKKCLLNLLVVDNCNYLHIMFLILKKIFISWELFFFSR